MVRNDGSAGRLGPFGHHAERLGQGLLVNGVPDPEPHPDPGHPATAGALAYGVQHALAQSEFVHIPPVG